MVERGGMGAWWTKSREGQGQGQGKAGTVALIAAVAVWVLARSVRCDQAELPVGAGSSFPGQELMR